MTLGQKLKQTRLARGMTQSQVVGDRITRNMLSQIENDLASPSVGTLEYLASVLNVRLSWLLADEQEEAEAGRTQRLRELLKSGEYAACLELAPEHAPDDEQALALAWPAAQCAQRALESERFDTARHLAQRGLAWNNGSLYASAALMLHLWDILAGVHKARGRDRRRPLLRTTGRPMPRSPAAPGTIWPWARYQLERGKTAAAEAELRAVPMPPEESRAEYRVLQARLASASGRYAEAMTALRQAERTGPLPKLLERELLQAMRLARPRTPGLQNGLRMRRPPAQAVMRGSTFSCAFLAAVVY